ncbi:MAG: DUF1223 domain-containing protein [Rubrivivax sp.]
MNHRPTPVRHRVAARAALAVGTGLAAVLALGAGAAAAAVPACSARSGATPPLVVELYTSEGCSSCPPADRWLSTLAQRGDVLPLAFHVDYWDRLGWTDRFASREGTERQYRLAQVARASNVYTPQVVADGRDWRGWPRLPAPAPPATAAPALTLERSGDTVVAEVAAAPGREQLSGYWAVLEDGHSSRVAAGENAGETLRHDHVVRLYRPADAWDARTPHRQTLRVLPGVPAHPRRVAFVVTDPSTLRPLQAAVLPVAGDC